MANNQRLDRFNEALNKFLELLDERATKENFQTALPNIQVKLLDGARQQFVFHLKDAIKLEKDRLVDNYQLKERLAELEQLAKEADGRSDGLSKPADTWRPGLDLPTLLHAPSVVQQRDTVESLERELQEILQSNDRDHLQLKTILQNTEEQRTIAKNTLDILEKSAEGLEMTPEEQDMFQKTIQSLLNELGPRSAG